MGRSAYDAGLSHFPDNPRLAQRSTLGTFSFGSAISMLPIPGASLIGAGITAATSGGSGGLTVDQQRQARVNWTLAAAKQGSTLATAIIIAAPANVAGDEAPMWRTALAQVPTTMLTAAYAQYPSGYWPSGQPDFYTDTSGPTHRQIVQETIGAGSVGATVGSAVQNGINSILRPSNALPGTIGAQGSSSNVLLLGGLVVAGLLFMRKR